MVGYQGLKGNDPQTAVNIETLISSLRLLQVREEHEVAPFVTNWISSLSDLPVAQFERETATQLVQALRDAREKESVYHLDRINTAIAEIARAELRPSLTAPLRQAEKYVLGRLTEILREHGPVDYLSPLINLARNQPGGADVITLNYDLTVESAAEGYVDLNRGFESSWNPGDELIFPVQEDTLNLIKLHGSLDWSMEQEAAPPYDLVSTRGVHLQTESSEQDESPWLVVGDRDKLATDGPIIELNYAARLALRRTDHLVIVGYSFRDEHINALLRDWIARDPDRTMTVLDLEWKPFSDISRFKDAPNFRTQLVAMYAPTQDRRGNSIKPRLLPIEGTASEKLDLALHSLPSEDPDPLMRITKSRNTGSAETFVLTWNGPDLHRPRIAVVDDDEGTGDSSIYSPEGSPSLNRLAAPRAYTRFATWQTGAAKTIILTRTTGAKVVLRVSGGSIRGPYKAEVSV